MRVKVIAGIVEHSGNSHGIGDEFDCKKAEGLRLINMGVAANVEAVQVNENEPGNPENNPDNDPPSEDGEGTEDKSGKADKKSKDEK